MTSERLPLGGVSVVEPSSHQSAPFAGVKTAGADVMVPNWQPGVAFGVGVALDVATAPCRCTDPDEHLGDRQVLHRALHSVDEDPVPGPLRRLRDLAPGPGRSTLGRRRLPPPLDGGRVPPGPGAPGSPPTTAPDPEVR